MRYLITGASGFIGKVLVRFILNEGHEVVALRNRNEIGFKHGSLVELSVDFTIQSEDSLFDKMRNIDIIIHCGSSNDILSKEIAKGYELMITGFNFLDSVMRRNKDLRCVYVLSTLQVFGTELSGCYTANTPPCIESHYASNHLLLEYMMKESCLRRDVPCCIIRPSNVLGVLSGKSLRWNLVPGCFVREIEANKTITLMSSGLQVRNFVLAEQIANYIIRSSNVIHDNEIILACSSTYLSILDCANITKNYIEERYNIEINLIVGEGGRANSFNLSNIGNGLAHNIFDQTDLDMKIYLENILNESIYFS